MLNTTTTEKLRDEVHQLILTDTPTDAKYRTAAKLLSKEMAERRLFWRIRLKSTVLPSDKSFLQHRELLLAESPKPGCLVSALLLQYTIPQELHILAMIPIGAMVLGIVCLLISVISFAAYTQHRNVWLACVIATAITVFYSLSSLMIVEMASLLETKVVSRSKSRFTHPVSNYLIESGFQLQERTRHFCASEDCPTVWTSHRKVTRRAFRYFLRFRAP
jgi:hypothetical protein